MDEIYNGCEDSDFNAGDVEMDDDTIKVADISVEEETPMFEEPIPEEVFEENIPTSEEPALSKDINEGNLPIENCPSIIGFPPEGTGNPSFGRASESQDRAFQGFKNYLNYHCDIAGYKIPYKEDLINYAGDYDRGVISKLETWVRGLYAKNKISSYDQNELFKYLNLMK